MNIRGICCQSSTSSNVPLPKSRNHLKPSVRPTQKGVDYMPSGSNRIIRFCGWWLEFFGTKLYMWAISYCRFWDCILYFSVHFSTDSFIPGAKGGTSIFSDFFCCSIQRFYTNSYLLVGRGRYIVPKMSKLNILITPTHWPPRSNLTPPSCSPTSN